MKLKNRTLVFLLVSLFFALTPNAYAGIESLGVFTLSPGETRKIEVISNEPIDVGFQSELNMESARERCKAFGVELFDEGKRSGGSNCVGLGLTAIPVNGKVSVRLRNKESFSIQVLVYRK